MNYQRVSFVQPHSPDEALYLALHSLNGRAVFSDSRNGPVARFPGLVITEWVDPTQRISWSPVRDANPFLHYIEAFWMLAGRNDVALPSKLAANMQNYSDDGSTLYGAYGFRWRNHFSFDQITAIINELKRDPTSRRCVLQMWDGKEELQKALSGGKDVCCNHAITFDPCDGYLNMSVSNRSNDLVWGAYGANVVHMSILHEYVAAQTGLKLGSYFQNSSNLHLYLNNPVTSRLVVRDTDDVLKAEPARLVPQGLNVDFERAAKMQESLFDDVSSMHDSEFHWSANNILNAFMNFEPAYSSGGPRSLELLGIMCDLFNMYKKEGANAAVALAQSAPLQSYWVYNAIMWLQRRPSYQSSKKAHDGETNA